MLYQTSTFRQSSPSTLFLLVCKLSQRCPSPPLHSLEQRTGFATIYNLKALCFPANAEYILHAVRRTPVANHCHIVRLRVRKNTSCVQSSGCVSCIKVTTFLQCWSKKVSWVKAEELQAFSMQDDRRCHRTPFLRSSRTLHSMSSMQAAASSWLSCPSTPSWMILLRNSAMRVRRARL